MSLIRRVVFAVAMSAFALPVVLFGQSPALPVPATQRAASRPSLSETNEAVRRVEAYLQSIPKDIRFDADIVYRELGKTKLRLDVYRPRERRRDAAANRSSKPDAGRATHKRAAVIYVHGGAWKVGTKAMGRSLLIDLARRGYVAFSIDYRLVPEGRFPRCIEDCKAAVRWVKAHAAEYGVDADRIGLIGASAGAHLAALMAVSDENDFRTSEHADQTGKVAAVVALFGPFDLRGYGEFAGGLVNSLVGGSELEKPETYRRASPYTYVDATKGKAKSFPPFLFVHGDADELVGIDQSRRMCKVLCDAGCKAELIEVRGGTHGLMFGDMDPSPAEFRRKMFQFLETNLRRPGDARP